MTRPSSMTLMGEVGKVDPPAVVVRRRVDPVLELLDGCTDGRPWVNAMRWAPGLVLSPPRLSEVLDSPCDMP